MKFGEKFLPEGQYLSASHRIESTPLQLLGVPCRLPLEPQCL